MDFESDPEKSAASLAEHGIDFEAAQALWSDERRIRVSSDFPDEERWIVIGAIGERLWTAATTLRGDVVRITSVRRARRKEEVLYGSQDD
ncbi:MAG TPA: BrnT family toxin [Allosphingosinicella sp.]|nr:BrnT family toxin [Allosphingosinicella sp.]